MAGKPTTPSENLSISQPAEAATSPAPQMIDISRIQPYEHNPRDFIVHAGGNTRLIILKELFAETGDPRFAAVPCLLKAWCCESDVLLAHLRENDLRGGLTFIDKARAVCEAQKLLAEELSIDVISQRRLETELRRAGYRITQARISQMVYTVHRLLPVIPIALEGGLGRPHVERIRRLERAAHKIWQDRCSESAEDFEEVFTTLCKRYDSPDWDTDVLRSALESEIAAALDVSIHTVRVMLDAEMAGRELVIPLIRMTEVRVYPVRIEHPLMNYHRNYRISRIQVVRRIPVFWMTMSKRRLNQRPNYRISPTIPARTT